MRNAKTLIVATMLTAILAFAILTVSRPTTAAPDQKTVEGNHWRHYDGHWNYWDNGDQRWYYTDGTNWFYNDGKLWNIYAFDKQFGREGFEKGEYKAPLNGRDIKSPQHGYYHAQPRK